MGKSAKETVECTGCGKCIERNRDVFQISSPFKEDNIHSCQMCWNIPIVREFQELAAKRGLIINIKSNED
jgi:hypothetical protein